jgi:hypothetical protein
VASKKHEVINMVNVNKIDVVEMAVVLAALGSGFIIGPLAGPLVIVAIVLAIIIDMKFNN